MREYTEETRSADMRVIHNCRDRTDEALEELEDNIRAMLTEMGTVGESYAKKHITDNGSIVTGRLRNSITWDSDGEAVYIGTNVEYAPYVEARKPFLKPAVAEHASTYKSIAKKHLPNGK